MQGFDYSVDIVLCIDATGSMYPVIGKVKQRALKFHDDLQAAMVEKGKVIDDLRIKVIQFRDFYHDGDQAIRISDFFQLPGQSTDFSAFIQFVEADGGGDAPESGLEAIALAMQSDWTKTGAKRRHVIVVWTDTSVHPLDMNAGSKPANYPEGMPADFDELTDLWEGQTGLNHSAKRMIIFSPDTHGWTDISNHWTNVVHYPSQAGNGLLDVDYDTIIDTVAQSV